MFNFEPMYRHTPTKELAPLRNPPPLPEQKAKLSQRDTSTTKPSPDETDFTEVRAMKKKHKKRQEKAGDGQQPQESRGGPQTLSSETLARRSGDAWFDPRPSLNKDFKTGISS
ncbi:hypothetical protein ElyMa_004951400 [Elysia marginata]|uniref:Uncharacterized protein n=1 Tax=Elysia marginata TaxID=1093978 RepID=A0AAV4J420_9GAST|nr:hypothetical protein ElyMa_004951400 [Elysia marginata]